MEAPKRFMAPKEDIGPEGTFVTCLHKGGRALRRLNGEVRLEAACVFHSKLGYAPLTAKGRSEQTPLASSNSMAR